MNFEKYYKQYIAEAKSADISLIEFLKFCKIRTTLTPDDRNTIIQIYKEGPKFIKRKNRKCEVESIINKNFKVK